MRSRLGVLSALVALAVLSVWSCGDVPDDPVAPGEDSSLAPDLDGIFASSQVASQRVRVILRHPDMASQRAVAAAARAQGVPVLHQYRRLPFTAMKVSESALQGLLRSGPFAEGWAVYTERMMADAGYLDRDPLFRLMQLKFYARAVANAILDQGVHVEDWTKEQAMDLMVRQTFQQEREAEARRLYLEAGYSGENHQQQCRVAR